MDASQRWETEALRSGSLSRKTPPGPEATEQKPSTPEPHDSDRDWVTLKEAEAATGIPTNTLRKWVRKSKIPSYLESDGDISLRMVDLDAVTAHAHDLGRDTVPVPESSEQEDQDEQDDQDDQDESPADAVAPEGTLIVPLDAWNRMLNQLGNLHEAGQHLAEARERAAKAETEAKFLRERLAEMRESGVPLSRGTAEGRSPDAEGGVPLSRGTAEGRSPDAGGSARQPQQPPSLEDSLVPPKGGTAEARATTSYWRYLTFGWRDRKRSATKKRP